MFMKTIFAIFVTTLVSQTCFPQSITGTILSSVDKSPIAHASVSLANASGTVSDSVGHFVFSRLQKGRYSLRFSAIHYESLDTTVVIQGALPLQLEIILRTSCDYDAKRASEDIQLGHPKLLIVGSIAPIANSKEDDQFERTYGLTYFDFGDSPPADACIRQYNEVIFQHLNSKFGKKWQKHVRSDVHSLK